MSTEIVVCKNINEMESKVLNNMPKTIDEIFQKFNERAELLLRKYDKGFADLEKELQLAGQLKLIQQRKEKLKHEIYDLGDVDGSKESVTDKNRANAVADNHNEISQYHELPTIVDDGEDLKDSVSEKDLLKAHMDTGKKNEDDPPSSDDVATSHELGKKLQLSIQLAAKYKEQVINLENNLHYTARSEQSLRAYLHQAAQKEEDAKRRLELFITGLLERAEDAEHKVKVYKTKLREAKGVPRDKSIFNDGMPRRQDPHTSDTVVIKKITKHKQRPYSSYAPASPLPVHRSGKPKRRSPKHKSNNYVAQFLEPPSSQELPRRWRKANDRRVDQLPGVDLSNVVDTSILWPFSQNENTKIQPKQQNDVTIRRRIVLFCVFAYLETEQLLTCAMVCREWRDVSKHPKLWTRISFDSKRLSSEFLTTMSAWCKETCYLSLSNSSGRNKRQGETQMQYEEHELGSLEEGMECLLQACGKNLLILSITNCGNCLTRRVLWMASCYNRELKSITFRSTIPIDAEVTWSLGSGCRKLLSLDIAPLRNSDFPEVFNNRVVQMVSWSWPALRGLSIGGKCVDKKGLISIATNCHRLQVLELAYMNEISENLARELVKKGLRTLRSLILTHTPIRPRALGILLRLAQEGSLVATRIQLSFSDYCPTEGSQPAIILNNKFNRSELFEAYNAVMQSLLRMQNKQEYRDILEIICTA